MSVDTPTLKRKDFQSDQMVKWCPGCGDYAILASVQSIFAELGIPKEKFAVVSGIGCSSRFPYYMETYGFHSIHGRAPAVASGLKLARPDLDVWVITGDGDAMSIGGNHLIHALRRNVGMKILMFNNRIYGLTKGQYSPTSVKGKVTKSTPVGSLDNPFNPLSLAIGSGATFVARGVDIMTPHLKQTLRIAATHQGSAYVEIYQNCNIFNDKAFAYMTDKDKRKAEILMVEHGKPLLFGENMDRGIRLGDQGFEIVNDVKDPEAENIMVWDAHREDSSLAFMLAQFGPPLFPTPIGVFRSVEEIPYEEEVVNQILREETRKGPGSLEDLIYSGEVWSVD